MDGTRYDFKGLKATGVADETGDKAFDEDEFSTAALPGIQVVNI
jgi:tRNA 2-thiocytidine biosynthesis protein TtcA